MQIFFRTDASVQIGTGHVQRCLTLADALTRQGHECWFICREHPGHLGDLIVSKGHNLTLLPASSDTPPQQHRIASDDYARWLGVPWQVDANETLEAFSTLKPDWLVVDHYALDAQWERTLSSAVSKIMVIDDLANRPHECALLLDQNLGRVAEDYDGLLPLECLRLVGPRYALLRPEFAEFREQSLIRRKPPKLKRILISLGGVDCTNATGQVLTALAQSSLPVGTELDIIMGATAPYLKEVRRQAAQLQFTVRVSVDVQDMAKRMFLADLSIGAAGGTSWERSCLGLPAILVVLAENQVSGAEALETAGAARTICEPSLIGEMLPSIFTELSNSAYLMDMSNAAAFITDGNGVFKVVSIMSAIER
ncbi:UDP-2,4-diacetamido-2,4,6-trideoxy-beta-L-altropyranose hydrolase [Marinobacterium sp. xm-d-564]|uniref:UDP-2,4-diacetamido-2,4, 6-trideoxy-beta-L-altropyranose hydrolase n=1 Tax=Marinobacterium sp. xm-d-564 TaxID=2497742 RepID=UPI001569005F|nr:UDP-2,4-diacetamido-2,4,6-trideoxy-beta-L-altropyranose hydrolase [Marinobacterium sp. xm-d-564]